MTHRAISQFWDGPDLYLPGQEVNLSPEALKTLERTGKVERIAEPSQPEPEEEEEAPPAPPRPPRAKSPRS